MGNSRGNHYSRAHTSLDVNSEEFWKFSWHEMAQYDDPAVIDYVLHVTGQEDLIWVGHSQGTTQMFIFNELHPEYIPKIKAFIALAPVAFMGHSDSTVLQLISHFQAEITVSIIRNSLHFRYLDLSVNLFFLVDCRFPWNQRILAH